MDEETVLKGLEVTIEASEEEQSREGLNIQEKVLYSEYLEREVVLDVYAPYEFKKEEVAILLINDGQDLRTMNFETIVQPLVVQKIVEVPVCIGIHCGTDRMNEYGTIYRTDFMGRGAKAGRYSKFVLDELLPFLKKELQVISFKEKAFAGFSLGGLSALDLVWNYPAEFTKAGVFSASLWWRRYGYNDKQYNEAKDRIMHLQVKTGSYKRALKFFFECGKLDETADRNNNGIIDSIEDTLDLISDLKTLGYTDDQIKYLELEDGEHNVKTWGRAFPEFLKWGWGI